MSVDQVFAHIKREEWIKENPGVEIGFPIIADTGNVAETIGLIHSGKGTNTVCAVFIVDADSKIRIILYYPQEIGRNLDEIVRALEVLQTSDKHGVVTSADWPNNELLGADVIIPPARGVQVPRLVVLL